MESKLTIIEASLAGYMYAGYRDKDEQSIKILGKITQTDFDNADGQSGPLVLCSLNPYAYTISEDVLRELVVDHICAQDEVADEDGELADTASEANFKPLVEEINRLMFAKKFYDLTDIELLPNPTQS